MTGRDPDEGDETDPRDPPSDDWPADWTTAADATDDDAPDSTDEGATDSAAGSPSDDSEPASSDSGEQSRSDEQSGTHEQSGSAGQSGSSEPSGSDRAGSVDRRQKSTSEKPPAPAVDDAEPSIADDGVWTWFRTSNHGAVVVVRDVASSVATVAAIGLILFAISGIWPPLVAVESGSMEPHMSKGDLVFIVDETRFAPQSSVDDTGVSTLQSARDANGYAKFGNHGDVIVYKPSGGDGTPIIHRARFFVEEGENWIDRADPAYLGAVDDCREVPRNMCPAPYDGFVTKGDANPTYDQIGDQSTIVKSEWIRGKAAVRIPLLGWIRLQFADLALASTNATGSVLGSAGGLATRVSALAIGLLGLARTSPA